MKHVVIVGSGPASFFLARRLIQQGADVRVTVLEGGPRRGAAPERAPIREFGRPFQMSPTTHLGFGGTSELWHNVLAPLDPIDFKVRDWVEHSGWPIDRSTLDRHYLDVARYLAVPAHLFFEDHLPADVVAEAAQLPFDREVLQNKIFLHPQRYFRAAEHFNRLVEESQGRITIQCDALVEEVVLGSAGQPTAVRFANLVNGRVEALEADTVVLCAGGLRSARILMNSELSAEVAPQVGRHLMDHPMGVLYQFRTPARQHIRLYTDRPLQPGCKIKSALRLTDECQRAWQMPNSAFYLRPSFKEGPDNATEAAKLRLLTLRSRLLEREIPWAEMWALLSNPNLTRQVIQYKTGLLSRIGLFDIMFVTEQLPGRASITLDDSVDEWGYRQSQIHWGVEDLEIECVHRMYDVIDRHLVHPFGGRMTFPLPVTDWRHRYASAAHHLGACRMGHSSSDSVVDAYCQVHGHPGVYVCDGSVFATAGNANPTFTIMALANRLGEHLAVQV